MKKTIITSFLLGIFTAVFCFHAYTVYQVKRAVNEMAGIVVKHEQVLFSENGIVPFLNKATGVTQKNDSVAGEAHLPDKAK